MGIKWGVFPSKQQEKNQDGMSFSLIPPKSLLERTQGEIPHGKASSGPAGKERKAGKIPNLPHPGEGSEGVSRILGKAKLTSRLSHRDGSGQPGPYKARKILFPAPRGRKFQSMAAPRAAPSVDFQAEGAAGCGVFPRLRIFRPIPVPGEGWGWIGGVRAR